MFQLQLSERMHKAPEKYLRSPSDCDQVKESDVQYSLQLGVLLIKMYCIEASYIKKKKGQNVQLMHSF